LLSLKILLKKSCQGKKTFDLAQEMEGSIYPETPGFKLPK